MRAFSFSRADHVGDAIAQQDRKSENVFVAGGTSLLDLVKLDVVRPKRVIDLNQVGLDSVETLPNGGLKIGALVRNSDLARHPLVRANYPVLAEAILAGASSQLRNMATTGGNLLQRTRCSYFRDNFSPCNKRQPGSGCAAIGGQSRGHAILGTSEHCIATHPSDMCVALAVLNAEIIVQGPGGARAIPIAQFHRAPGETPHLESALESGEVITAVTLPPAPSGARSWYVKLRDREAFSFALASVAVWFAPSTDSAGEHDIRIALGGVATKPWRATEAEASLRTGTLTTEAFRKAADLALQAARPTAHNAFKIDLAKLAIIRALSLVAAGQPSVRKT